MEQVQESLCIRTAQIDEFVVMNVVRDYDRQVCAQSDGVEGEQLSEEGVGL